MTAITEELAKKIEVSLAYIKSHPEGVIQSNLWKELEMDSRTCSRIIKYLLETETVAREEIKGGSFLIKAIVAEKEIDPMLFMAGDSLLPCVACTEECDVPSCKMLEDWIYELVFAEME